MRSRGSLWARYLGAALCSAAGLAATAASVKLLAGPFFIFDFAAVVGAALYGGIGPGAVATVLSGIGFTVLFFGPTVEMFEVYRLLSFGLVSALFVWITAKVRDARADAEVARSRAEASEAQAQRIGAQQEQLVAVVSHDLRTPLTAIILIAARLVREVSGPQAHAVSRIAASARRMDAIVRDLLDYALARHGSGLPVRVEAARLGEVCRLTIAELRAADPNPTVHLEVTGDDGAPLDTARVQQVVANLVTNAVKHGARHEPVQVRVTGSAAHVQLEVTNAGPPIPEELAPTLFEPFRTGGDSTRNGDLHGNFGLGLFIVREIVHAHHGSVAVCSGEVETTFTVTFPKAATGAPAPERAPAEEGHRDSS